MEPFRKKVFNSKLRVEINDSRPRLKALIDAITPETKSGKKCKMRICGLSRNDSVSLIFESKDMVSLRASLNTNLRLVSAALKTIDAVADSGGKKSLAQKD